MRQEIISQKIDNRLWTPSAGQPEVVEKLQGALIPFSKEISSYQVATIGIRGWSEPLVLLRLCVW